MEVVCDKCDHEWTLSREDIKTGYGGEWKGEPLSRQYFRCPQCLRRHVIAYYTRKIERILDKQQKIKRRLFLHPSRVETLQPKLDKIREWLREQQAIIKEAKGESNEAD